MSGQCGEKRASSARKAGEWFIWRRWQSSCQQRCSSRGTGRSRARQFRLMRLAAAFASLLPVPPLSFSPPSSLSRKALNPLTPSRGRAGAPCPAREQLPQQKMERQQAGGLTPAPAAQGQSAESRVFRRTEQAQPARRFQQQKAARPPADQQGAHASLAAASALGQIAAHFHLKFQARQGQNNGAREDGLRRVALVPPPGPLQPRQKMGQGLAAGGQRPGTVSSRPPSGARLRRA